MKDGRTHLALKVEHAVDLESGAVVAVNLAPGDAGDTSTVGSTVCEAGEQITTVASVTPSEGVNPDYDLS
jgi:transposase